MVQFVISIVMLVATIVVMDQLRYMQHKDLGYQREQVFSLDPPAQASESQKSAFRNELRQLAGVRALTQVSLLPRYGSRHEQIVASVGHGAAGRRRHRATVRGQRFFVGFG